MKNVLLLARAYVRQNRWLVVVLLLWPWIFGGLLIADRDPGSFHEYGTMIVQEGIYAIAIAGFSASAAFNNERRSRRMAGVLAKAVSRRQYLAGFLAGILAIVVAFTLSMWLVTEIAAQTLHGQAENVLPYILTVTVAAAWVASLGLALATFVHPMLATMGATLAATLPLLASRHASAIWSAWIPTMPLLTAIMRNPLAETWAVSPAALASAAVQSAVFIAAGAWILERRDVTVATE